MSQIAYLTNDDGEFAEWSSTVAAGDSTITEIADAAKVGACGIRCSMALGSSAYAWTSAYDQALAGGDDLYIGFYFRASSVPANLFNPIATYNTSDATQAAMYLWTDGKMSWYVLKDAGGSNHTDDSANVCDGDWHWIVVQITRSTGAGNGGGSLWVDGSELAVPSLENATKAASFRNAKIGVPIATLDGWTCDIDEVVISLNEYPDPAAGGGTAGGRMMLLGVG